MSKDIPTHQFKPEDYSTPALSLRSDRTALLVKRYEPRTCRKDYSAALSFQAHDPYWMLTRQWQFGRFQGNDCGSAISSTVALSYTPVDGICKGRDMSTRRPLRAEEPWEPSVEAVPVPETLAVRVESALYLKRLIRPLDGHEEALRILKDNYPMEADSGNEDPLEELVDSANDMRTLELEVFQGRIFDGAKVYHDAKNAEKLIRKPLGSDGSKKVMDKYLQWYKEHYQPDTEDASCWEHEKLGYSFTLTARERQYAADNYASGHVGWHTFDAVNPDKPLSAESGEVFSYIPTRASFPSAPSLRLWEYEDRGVSFQNLKNDDVSQLSSAVIMEYVSMYSNDWMIVPVHTRPGTVVQLTSLKVKDCFGGVQLITRTPEDHDAKKADVPFSDRWSMFGNTRADAYKKGDFTSAKGLLLPSSLLRVEEGESIEEVQFMRDEMANMLWGVEEVIDDGCGGTMSGRTLSGKVLSMIDEERGDTVLPDEDAEFSYLIQNRVPLNWIPFIPQRIPGQFREMRFRRGRMPLYYKGDYRWARPHTSVLAVKRVNGAVQPFYVNEEEILSYGTKVTLTSQRTRWIGGKSFAWRGYAKKISGYQANSGLMFDEIRKTGE